MGNKNKTISFRVSQDAFEELRDIAEERDLSLSALFRNYVDTFVAHDGAVEVVPEHELDDTTGDDASFPPTVEVPKSFIRDHERLELEADHMQEQLEECRGYIEYLHDRLESDEDDVVHLDELDIGDEDDAAEPPFDPEAVTAGDDASFRIGKPDYDG